MKTDPPIRKDKRSRRTAQTARIFLFVLGGILFIAANVLLTGNVNASQNPQTTGAQTPIPSPMPTFDPVRLASPVVPQPPAQVDKGAIIFWGVCIACHGDMDEA